MSNEFLSIDQLKRALAIEEQIAALREELRTVLGNPSFKQSSNSVATKPGGKDARRGKRSAATRAKMAAAQKARWAKSKSESTVPAKGRKKRVLSPEARARIVAAQKKRWAAIKAAGKAKA